MRYGLRATRASAGACSNVSFEDARVALHDKLPVVKFFVEDDLLRGPP